MALAIAGLVLASVGNAEPEANDRPDLSGWWVWESPRNGETPNPFIDAPFQPMIATEVAAAKEAFRRAEIPDPADRGVDSRRENCKPPRFSGFNGGFEDAVEFLFTPGRLTITNESGLIRRIPMDGSVLPDTAEESNAGTSVGRWEGQALVIETIGTRTGPQTWGKAHFTERFTLRDADTLEIAVHIVAPEVLERPYDKTLIYTRDQGHVFREYTACVDNDPSFDPTTGRQKLDLTPPPDLPPPPTD
jgi:hypothetical protein